MLILPMAGLTPIIMTGTVPTQNRPDNVAGVWVTLAGRGGEGAAGGHVSNSNQNTTGGAGGGGGAYIARVWIPVSALGPTFSLTIGTTSSRFARFISGGITLSAGWGANGGNGGVATAVGFTDGVILANGGKGGSGGSSSPGAGGPGQSVTNGAGAGGGGGGGARSAIGQSKPGGAAGTSNGPCGDGWPGNNGSGGSSSATGGTGGDGGGWTDATASGPGEAFSRLEWA